ncbi:hypothetical protein TNCT_633331 [Trichonephila clavata]|uniref:Uncharacterized protein n=1 Tax=Trichonephila clavata TaxID=2740835 RepID=A0A8X6FJ09_TRICU|nr:hypothetical protein TNCT_633331 [Trichonephila clavata]
MLCDALLDFTTRQAINTTIRFTWIPHGPFSLYRCQVKAKSFYSVSAELIRYVLRGSHKIPAIKKRQRKGDWTRYSGMSDMWAEVLCSDREGRPFEVMRSFVCCECNSPTHPSGTRGLFARLIS